MQIVTLLVVIAIMAILLLAWAISRSRSASADGNGAYSTRPLEGTQLGPYAGLSDGSHYVVRGYGLLVAKDMGTYTVLCRPAGETEQGEQVLAVMRFGTRIMDAGTLGTISLRRSDIREVIDPPA